MASRCQKLRSTSTPVLMKYFQSKNPVTCLDLFLQRKRLRSEYFHPNLMYSKYDLFFGFFLFNMCCDLQYLLLKLKCLFYPFLAPLCMLLYMLFFSAFNYVQGTTPSYEQIDKPSNPSDECNMSANSKPQQSWYSFHDTNGICD